MKFIALITFSILISVSIWAQTPKISDDSSNSAVQETRTPNKNQSAVTDSIQKIAEKNSPVTVVKFQTAPVIDGRLDDEVWKQSYLLKNFVQTAPGDNLAPSKETEFMIGYDEKYLYLAFRCFDEKDKIRATVTNRDNVFGEDNVRVWLDTYNDQRRAYVIGFNPYGIQQDGIYTEGGGTDYSVDLVMESKGVIEDWGWSVEAKIPFKSLRYTAGKDKLWGFNAARNIDRLNDELDSWMPDNRNISGVLIKHGKLTGLDEIKTERTLEITPSVTISESGNRVRTIPRYLLAPNAVDPGRFVNQPIKQDVGVTVKFGITPNITLDAAINPDFAEIEADAPVVSANQRFPIFFQEKRPFFLEGVEIFRSPLNVFYSRTIVDPDAAVKLTGKIGRNSFGFLVASDKAPGNYPEDDRNDPSIRPRIDEFLDKNASFAVVRLKRDIGRENSVGFFGTFRSFPEQKNLVGGFDGRFKVNATTVFSFQAVGSNSKRCFFDTEFEPLLNPQQVISNKEICGGSTYNRYRAGNGLAYYANLDHTTDTFGYTVEVGGRSRDYRSDAGFNRRTNSNYLFGGFRLSTKTRPKAAIIRASTFNRLSVDYNWQGQLTGIEAGSNLSFNLQKNTYLNLNGGVGFERIFEEEFGLKRMPSRPDSGAFFGSSERTARQGWVSINFDKQFNKQFSLGVGAGTIFNAFDFDFGGGDRFPRVSPAALAGESKIDPGVGRQIDFGFGIGYKPIEPLSLSVEYNKTRLIRNDTKLTAFDSDIVSLRSSYQFTRFIFIRSRLDYSSLDSNYSGQLLVGWNPSPGTAFYAGYNDNSNFNGFNPFTGQFEPRFERNSRTFFIRASYLFRKSF